MSSRMLLANCKHTTLQTPSFQPSKRLVASPKNSPQKVDHGMISPSDALWSPRIHFAEIGVNNLLVRTPDKNLKEAVSPSQQTPISTNSPCNSLETTFVVPHSERADVRASIGQMLDMDEESLMFEKTFTADSMELFLHKIGMAKYIETFEGINFMDFQGLHCGDLISMGIEETDAIDLAKKIEENY